MLQQPVENSNPHDGVFSLEVPLVTGNEAKGMIIQAIPFDEFFRTQFPTLCAPDGNKCPECNGPLEIKRYEGICSGSCPHKTKTVIDLVMIKHDWYDKRSINHLAAQVGFAVAWSKSHQVRERQRELLTAALSYTQEYGWKVSPLHFIEDGRCSCGKINCGRNSGKHPITKNGLLDATNEVSQVLEWWSWKPLANIGIATGKQSNIVVVDIDFPDGEASLAALVQEHGSLPPTIEQRSGSGGRHLIFAYPDGHQIPSHNEGKILGKNIDIKADGGYIVVQPSNHLEGDYSFIPEHEPGNMNLAELPPWIVQRCIDCSSSKKSTSKATCSGTGKRPLVLEGLLEGERDSSLASQAGYLIAKGTPLDVVEDLIIESGRACDPPFGDEDARKKFESILKTHMGNHSNWVPPLSLKEARERCHDLLDKLKAEPSLAVQAEYIEALETVKKWDSETWISCKSGFRRYGILREVEKEIKKKHFQVVHEGSAEVTLLLQEFEKHNITPPDGVEALLMPVGYEVGSRGILAVTETEDGTKADEVCPAYIIPTKRYIDIQTGTEKVQLSHLDGEHWKSIITGRGTAVEARKLVLEADRQYPVGGHNAGAIAKYHYDFLEQNKSLLAIQKVTSKFGWVRGLNSPAFLIGTELIGHGEEDVQFFAPDGGDNQLAKGLSTKGTFDDWCKVIQPLGRFPVVRIMMYAALASPLVSLFECGNFILDVSSPTSVGKSTGMRVTSSIWGNPSVLVQPWDVTKVGCERICNVSENIPVFLDDSKVANKTTLQNIVYMLGNGSGRIRGSIHGMAATSSWRLIALSNGENPLSAYLPAGGAKTRILGIKAFPFEGESGKIKRLIDRLNVEIQFNHGHAGRKFVRWIIENWNQLDEFKSRYREETLRYSGKLSGIEARMANYMGIIALAGQLGEESGALPWTYEDPFTKEILDTIQQDVRDIPIEKRGVRLLMDWAVQNQHRFWNKASDDDRVPSGGWAGAWESGEYWKHVDIIPLVMKEVCQKNDIDYEAFLSAMERAGWMVTDRGHKTYPAVVAGRKTRVHRILRKAFEPPSPLEELRMRPEDRFQCWTCRHYNSGWCVSSEPSRNVTYLSDCPGHVTGER